MHFHTIPLWGHLSLLIICLLGLGVLGLNLRSRLSKLQSSDAATSSPEQTTFFDQKLLIARLETELLAHQECSTRQKILEQELQNAQEINQSLRLSEQAARLKAENIQQNLQEKISWLNESEERLKLLFQNVAHLCLEKTTQQNQEQHQKTLGTLLAPLKEQLEKFQTQIQEKFQHESKERHLLAHELSKIQQLNLQLSQDATNLTQALMGNQKVQGNWGEVLLEQALETSGLRKDHEYKLQVSLTHLQSEQRIQPDALIYLPHGRTVIVDAKISLTAYTRYSNAADAEKEAHLLAHIHSLKMHIKRLGKKSYYQAKGLETLDFVLLFVPLEPAFTLALQQAPELLAQAQSHHIMLVSPSTLLIALKTIQNLWQIERQACHANIIAAKASQLYDKFRLFLESFQSVGSSLDRAVSDYHIGLSRLSQGKGNILKQIESFQSLGVPIQKPLPINSSEEVPFSLSETEKNPLICTDASQTEDSEV